MTDVNLILLDLDGTLADNSHRTHLAREKRWEEYHAACPRDTPLPGAIALFHAMRALEETTQIANEHSAIDRPVHKVWVVTGRMETAIDDTLAWFEEHVGINPESRLIMRKQGDHQPNTEFKRMAIEGLVNTLCARDEYVRSILLIDDHPDAVNALADLCDVLPVRGDW